MTVAPQDGPGVAGAAQPGRAHLILADGTHLTGWATGATGIADGEVCFTTGMTGYQETLTDPSFAGQIIVFTQPELGVVGCNPADQETAAPAAAGMVARHVAAAPSNFRATMSLPQWLARHGLPGISGIDTRALTRHLRDRGTQMGRLVALARGETLDASALARHKAQVAAMAGMAGRELAAAVSRTQPQAWQEGGRVHPVTGPMPVAPAAPGRTPPHVVAMDFGAKANILRCLAAAGARVTVVPATTTAEAIRALRPDGLFLSNGPGDPAATGNYAVPVLRALLDDGLPVLGICLGHQLLAHALGAQTAKMHHGHRGANQPVQHLASGRVHVTSQNHGFQVLAESLPDGVRETERSLFDGSNEGLELVGRPVFSVQYHPEASPGPHDTLAHFDRFVALLGR